ncbi:hypothetical protein ABZP36_003944 [Zizania latifolia]
MESSSYWTAFWLLAGSNLALLMFASSITAFVSLVAGGSGIPKVKAYLNGVDAPNVFSLRTLAVKMTGASIFTFLLSKNDPLTCIKLSYVISLCALPLLSLLVREMNRLADGIFDHSENIADGMTGQVGIVNLLLETHGGPRHQGSATWSPPLAAITFRDLVFLYFTLQMKNGSQDNKRDDDGAKQMFFGGERFLEGIFGEANHAEDAGSSLVSIIIDHIFLCIKDAGWICYAEKTLGSYILPYISSMNSKQHAIDAAIRHHMVRTLGLK